MQVGWIAVSAVGALALVGAAENLAWAQPAPLDYFSVAPCRLLDTRVAGQGPALASGASRIVTVTGGACGIPASARAIAANIASVAPSGGGNLRLYPGDGALPQTSALNFGAGQTRANNGVFPLAGDGDGTLAIRATVTGGGTVHAVLDLTGYFEPAACSAVYLIDDAARLLRFEPRKVGTSQDPFTVIGPLSCPASPTPVPGLFPPVIPLSLTVDRNGSARVLYTSGEIFAVDVADASCAATSFPPQQGGQWLVFEQAFAADTSGGGAETQYVGGGNADGGPGGLFGRVNPTTLQIQTLGNLPNAGEFNPPLTGLGDGTLFAFFPGLATAFIQQIDKSTGAAVGPPIGGVPGGLGSTVQAWAFAHWGGDFYLFVTTDVMGNPNSTVRRIDRATGQYEVLLQNLPYRPVAAGVATCAPLTIN